MRRSLWGSFASVLALGLVSLPAAAVNTENYQVPYLGIGPDLVLTDSARHADNGGGYQISFGIPLGDGSRAFELTFFDHQFKRDGDGKNNYQTGVLGDYVWDYGSFGADKSWFKFKPYTLAGGGLIQEDAYGNKGMGFGVEAGGGVLFPIPFHGMAVRVEGRGEYEFNKKATTDISDNTGNSSVLDFRVMLGVQLPLTVFFDRKVPVPAAKECELTIVNPDTGRSDCATDSDRDGVADSADLCPGTPPGTLVDAKGCLRVEGPSDADTDGVADTADQCGGTAAGVKVDASGCAVSQTFADIAVGFAGDTPQLTEDDKTALKPLAEFVAQQANMKVEVASTTRGAGSDAFNQLLSQQRADAVRDYLVQLGAPADRLTAVGYGKATGGTEAAPVAGHIEFRIVVQ